MSIFLLVALIPYFALCDWTGLTEFSEVYCLYRTPCYDIYRSNLYTHVAYCARDSEEISRLYYRKINDDNTVGDAVLLDKEKICRMATITGNTDKDLIITLETERDGNFDVFYMISNDNGNSWSKLIQVPRENLSDTLNRTTPNALWMKESGRVWIFYSLSDFENDAKKSEIAFATRSPGSSIFSNEKKFTINYSLRFASWPKSAYACDPKIPQKCALHLAWTEYNTTDPYSNQFYAQYAYSNDLGISWSDPVTFTEKSFFRAASSIHAKSEFNNMLFITFSDEWGKPFLLWTEDFGQNWKINQLANSGAPQARTALCYNQNKENITLFTIADDTVNNARFGYLDLITKNYTEIPDGFYGISGGNGGMLICYNDLNEEKRYAISIIEGAGHKYEVSLFMNKYEFTPKKFNTESY